MDSRYNEMENFLNYYCEFIKQNPDFPINQDTFYHSLASYGLLPNERFGPTGVGTNPEVYGMFGKWIDHFQNVEHIDVYHHQNQRRFLQFSNRKGSSTDCYKLYLSFPKDKLFECVNIIFEYIASKDMNTFSKVADTLRSDSVVIRLADRSDAVDVINFINGNQTLVEAAKPVNPFLPRYGVVGYGYDRNLSYNDAVAFFLDQYFIVKKTTGTLDSVSVSDFKSFVVSIYKSFSTDERALEEFMKLDHIAKWVGILYNRGIERTETLTNFKYIIELIIQSLDAKVNVMDYLNKVTEFMNPQKNAENKKVFADLMRQTDDRKISEMNSSDVESLDATEETARTRAENVLSQFIVLATKKYGINNVHLYLESYLSGNQVAITRELGLREKFELFVSKELLQEIAGPDFDSYVKSVIDVDSYAIFNDACAATSYKYGPAQLESALRHGLEGDFNRFTNGGNRMLRQRLVQYVPRDKFQTYAKAMLVKMEVERQGMGFEEPGQGR